jgi:hypothetical protein
LEGKKRKKRRKKHAKKMKNKPLLSADTAYLKQLVSVPPIKRCNHCVNIPNYPQNEIGDDWGSIDFNIV